MRHHIICRLLGFYEKVDGEPNQWGWKPVVCSRCGRTLGHYHPKWGVGD